MRIALLANPDSGSGEADDVAAMLRDLGAEVETHSLDDVDAAIAAGPDRVVVAGGDGSLGCVAAPGGRAGVQLAVVPTGTANDFAREFGVPLDVADACELAVRGRRTRTVELGWMDERPFLNAASLGLSPAAARRASGLKGALGPLAYFAGALGAGLRAQPTRCAVTAGGESVFDGDAWQVTVACSGAFGAGSGVEADPEDGLLDVVVIEARSRLRLVQHAYGMRRARVAHQEGVVRGRGREVRLEFDGVRDFNLDGEVVRSASVTMRADPGAIEVVVG